MGWRDNVESNEQTANTNNQDNGTNNNQKTNTSTENSANDIGEVAAIEQAKDFPGGDVIDVQNIDWNSFHIDKDRTNKNEYHVKYYYNGISTPMPFEIIIDRETGEKLGANNLANKQQMEEYKSMLEKNEKERQQRLKELAEENNVYDKNRNNQQDTKENEQQTEEDSNQQNSNNNQQTTESNNQQNSHENEQ